MAAAPLPHDELQRLSALRACEILDTPPEAAFDRLTLIASQMLDTPIALVSLVDSGRQWFKARLGLEAMETPRDWAFCAHAILQHHEPLVVPDAAYDVRFHDNPLVVGDPKIRFYAGAPIVTRDGHALGTVCAIDSKPRTNVSKRDVAILKELAAIAADELELRILARQLATEIHRRETAEAKAHTAELARLRAEAEAVRQRATDALVHLTGGVAHEFNNLFAGLMMLAENIRARGDSDATMRGAMDTMLRSLERGARLTHGMLSYSGKQYLAPQALDLRGLLDSFAEMMRAVHGDALAIRIAVASDCAAIAADKRQLLAALTELVANAREAALVSGMPVTVSAANAARESADDNAAGGANRTRFVRIAVADTGRGMSPDVRERACEPFFTTKQVGAGPGLGLSMAQGFARQSGGFLTVDSKPGAGTTVAFHLPIADSRQARAPRTAA